MAPSSVADPSGGVVVGGQATISGQDTRATVVDQGSQRAIINWSDFSVAADGSVSFNQPNASAIALNRVVGENPSDILGQISANGRIVIVNPNGVLFGEGAQIDVAGLIATTHDISNESFMAGNLVFDRSSGANGYVVNEGLISVDEAGLAALVAPHVRNSGVISAKLGTVQLASSTMFTVDFYGDDLITFPVGSEVTSAPVGPDGAVDALVVNDGTVLAEGGSILMTASAARGVVDDVILAGGELVATSFTSQGGTIVLQGGGAGDVVVAGSLDASGAQGGTISIEGERVFADGAIAANGVSQGGAITVDGDWVSVGGSLAANGATGGAVNVSAGNLSLAGDISAAGSSGAGGVVDIAVAASSLQNASASIDVSGASGGAIRNVAGAQLTTSASYDASGSTGAGGQVDISAGGVKLLSASIDASGVTGGGRVRLGGEFQGGAGLVVDELPNTTILASSTGTTIDVSASGAGAAGGQVIAWSEANTLFQGFVDARPGAGGAGGFIEVSSRGTLGFNADLQTGGGEVLLDPKNLTIVPDSFNQLALILGYNYSGSPGGLNTGLASGDAFGLAVSLDGNRLAVGAPQTDIGGSDAGAVYLFSFSDSAFSNPVLEGIIGDGFSGGKNVQISLDPIELFGQALSLDGNRLAVGGPGGNNRGAVHFFTFTDSAFSGGVRVGGVGEGYATSPALNAADFFGQAVALDGRGLVVGAPSDDGLNDTIANSGAVHLFTFTDDVFGGVAYVGAIGADYAPLSSASRSLSNIEASDQFGASVSLDAGLLAVGALGDRGLGNSAPISGAIYLISFDDASFTGGDQEGIIGRNYVGAKDINVTATGLGRSVSLDDLTLAVGAPDFGLVHLFTFSGALFAGGAAENTIGFGGDITVPGVSASDAFGRGVSLDNGRLAIGASSDDGSADGLTDSGAVYLFNLNVPGPAFATFASDPGGNSTISVSTLLALLNAGNAVTLQANNDITVSTSVIVDNTGGDGGALTLEAGRSILLNGSIFTDNGALTLIANQTAAAGVVNAYRDAGDAVIAMANGVTIDAGTGDVSLTIASGADKTNFGTGAMTLGAINGGSIAAEHFGVGNVVLNGALTASEAGNSLIVRAANGAFINTAGAGALDAGLGRFVVFSQSPFTSALDGLTGTPFYNTPGESTNFGVLPNGDVFAYELAPVLTITANDATRLYGGSNPGFTYGVSGYINNDELLGSGLTGAPSLTTTANALTGVGDYNITAAAGSLASTYNYTLNFVDGTLTIDPAALTVTIDDANRTYGAANPTFTGTVTGFVNGEDDSVLASDPVYATTANLLSGVGDYAITGSSAAAANYTVTYVNGTLTVDPALLTVTIDDASRAYGAADPAFASQISGFMNGEDDSVLLSDPIFATTATQLSGVGDYAITGSGAAAANYTFAYVDGTLTINPALLTVTIDGATRGYGAANPVFTGQIAGFQNGEDDSVLTSDPIFATTANQLSGVGGYAITGSGAAAANYTFAYVNGTLTINPALLTVTVDDATRGYGAANPAFAGQVSGFVNGEDDGVLTSGPVFATTATQLSGVGDYAITGSGATASNYTFAYVDGTLTINPALLTVTIDGATRGYGAANPVFTGQIAGFQNGEDDSVLSSNPIFATTANQLSGVGGYAITGSGAAAANYTFAYVNGTLTINPALLTVTVDDKTRGYGAANPALTGQISGFQNGEDDSVLISNPAFATTANPSSAVGDYAITGSGAAAANYVFTYVDGTLTIDPTILTVTIDDASRGYGAANPVFSGTIVGFQNGEDDSILTSGPIFATTANQLSGVGGYAITGSGAAASNYTFAYVNGTLSIDPALLTVTVDGATRGYGAANPAFTGSITGFQNGEDDSVLASGPIYATTANQLSGVGGYAITGSGATASNYTFAYVNGTLTIDPATLTVTIDDATRGYGAANPALSGTISGFQNGEDDSVLTSNPIYVTVANQLSGVGDYAITGSGAAAGNYTFAYVDGTLSIDPAVLTVTVNNATRTYGAANPAFSGAISGFQNGETSSVLTSGPLYATTANPLSGVGGYAITASGAAASNYTFAYVDGTLTVNPALLTVTVGNAGRTYGDVNPAFSGGIAGFVNGEDDSVLTSGPLYATTATQSSNVGAYAITGSGATAANYTFAYVNGALTINPALLTVNVNNASRTYGDANPAFNASISGFKLGQTSSVVSGLTLATTATQSSNVGGYAITGSGATATNYTFAYAPGTLTINPAALLITPNNASRTYGDANPTFTATFSGFKLGQDASVLPGLSFTTAATQSSNVGAYGITASGATNANYTIGYGAAATLTINPAPLTVAVNNASKVQGSANPAFSATVTGFKLGQDGSVLSGLTFATPATLDSLPGSYVITSSGGLAANYVIAQRTDGTLFVQFANGEQPELEQVQNDFEAGVPLADLGGPADGDSAAFVFATATGATATGQTATDPATASNLLCVLAEAQECPVISDGGAE